MSNILVTKPKYTFPVLPITSRHCILPISWEILTDKSFRLLSVYVGWTISMKVASTSENDAAGWAVIVFIFLYSPAYNIGKSSFYDPFGTILLTAFTP